MKIIDIIERNRVMPHTAKPMGLIHKKGYGPNNRYGFKNVGNNKANEAVQYKAPNLDWEWKEAQRYPALAKLGLEGWKKLQGKEVNVKDLGGLQKIGNHTAPDQNTANKNLPNLEQGKVKRTQAMVKSGQVELPIVVKLPNGKMDLVGGNTRFTSLVAMGIIPDVWYIDASGLKENTGIDWNALRTAGVVQPMLYDVPSNPVRPTAQQPNIITAVNLKQELPPGEKLTPLNDKAVTPEFWQKYMDDWWTKNKNDPRAKNKIDQIKQSARMKGVQFNENFADGKVKGKSRPGRVKKAGASCSGSVTSLRAKAKKHGGEKGKMYHWCANMKSGRKKA